MEPHQNRMAYFMATYPALSETFVQREIDYFRKIDVKVFTFAVKRPPDLYRSKERLQKSADTIYARPDHIFSGLLMNLRVLMLHPLRFLKCMGLVLSQFFTHPFPEAVKLLFHLYAAPVFLHYLRKNEVTHIHAHFATASTIALFCNYLSGMSFSFTVHASGDIYSTPIMLKQKMKAAKFVIADCEYNKRYLNLVSQYLFEDKIEVVHNGVEIPDGFHYKKSRKDKIRLISIGNFTYFKGYPTLIEAISLLRQRGQSVSVDVIGDGPQRELIERLIQKKQLRHLIILHGTMEHAQLEELLKNADVFVFAAEIYLNGIRDGMPTVCTEAMALGLPVVSTYISAIPELIENGKSGLLVAENNPESLADAITVLIENPAYRYKLAKNGYRRAKEKFDVKVTMKRLAKVFSVQGVLV